MSPPVRLDHVKWIPRSIRADLARHRSDFERSPYADHIQAEPWFEQMANALQEIAARRDVIAFHCCREVEPGEIATRGLRVLEGNGDSHRAEFLERLGHLFPQSDREQMKRDFAQVWAGQSFSRGRENKLCFALAHPRHWGGGADDLLRIYGGEAIYATWGRAGTIVDKLRTIGMPAVVHFRISVDAIHTWMRAPVAGRTALWAWHRRLRPDVSGYWAEGYMLESVASEHVVKVERWLPPRRRLGRRAPGVSDKRASEEPLPNAAAGKYDELTDEELRRIIDDMV